MQQNKLSSKDLTYLSDIFNWNINCYNACKHFESLVDNQEAATLLKSIEKHHISECKKMMKLMK